VRSHDWRSPGFPAAVGGRLYDAACVPLASVGSNAPNLPFRAGQRETLAEMRAAQFRWVRVFATGHSLGPDHAPRSAAEATAALRRMLELVDTHNAANPPGQAIYVLVSLTDYYPPGVPGDRHGYDHPYFTDVPILPAPWYRPGIRTYDFDQEHGRGLLRGQPNYEVYYKPWVQEIVASLADSRALLGWQLGNELKARNSARNGITADEAYNWYLAFTRDMVDAIRELDRNHLIFMGAQYMAELVDWNYRPDNELATELLPTYRGLVQRALDACNCFCWNVWGLTGFDGNPFAVDDAMQFAQAGVATVYTEFGLTREVQGGFQQLFTGDRAAAVRSGPPASWIDLEGQIQHRGWSVPELFEHAAVDGVAPWGSAPRAPEAEVDADVGRGITYAPDEDPLWAVWREVAAGREAANRAAGSSPDCLALNSTLSR
jgi:hypothetical protein